RDSPTGPDPASQLVAGAAAHRHGRAVAAPADHPGRVAAGRYAVAVAVAAAARLLFRVGYWRGTLRLRGRRVSHRPSGSRRGPAERPPIPPCARPLPATAARG